jgi:hypothetical protein
MQIAWFFGFGWISVLGLIVCGAAIHLLSGAAAGVMYAPFLLVALYMTVRFRLYSTQPWRRAHSRAMIAFGELADAEYDAARRDERDYDVAVPCAGLAARLFGDDEGGVSGLLLDENRKKYYKDLVREFPRVFLEGIAEERREAVLAGLEQDIDASRPGPDILIARAIASRHSREEAARYLRALVLGKVE